MTTIGKIVVLLAMAGLALMGIAGFGAVTGNTSLLVVAVICLIPVGLVISMLARQIDRK